MSSSSMPGLAAAIAFANRLCSRMNRVCSEVSSMFSLARTSPAMNRAWSGTPGRWASLAVAKAAARAAVAGEVVERQQIGGRVGQAVRPRAALEPAGAVFGPQGVGDEVVGAVDHRGVDEGGDLVGLLARVAGVGAGPGHGLGAVEEDDLGAGV